MTHLVALPGRSDLPTSWDGVPVTWTGWNDYRTSMALHLPAEDLACQQCGAVDENLSNSGIRPAQPGEMWEGGKARIVKTGNQHAITTQTPAWPVRDLWAFRCRHCHHDQVHDHRTGESWDLDEDDYGPDGSTDIKDTLWWTPPTVTPPYGSTKQQT